MNACPMTQVSPPFPVLIRSSACYPTIRVLVGVRGCPVVMGGRRKFDQNFHSHDNRGKNQKDITTPPFAKMAVIPKLSLPAVTCNKGGRFWLATVLGLPFWLKSKQLSFV